MQPRIDLVEPCLSLAERSGKTQLPKKTLGAKKFGLEIDQHRPPHVRTSHLSDLLAYACTLSSLPVSASRSIYPRTLDLSQVTSPTHTIS